MDSNGDLLTLTQLADKLGVKRRTLERWHARRIGPPRIKLGKRVYYRPEAVFEWMLANEQAEPCARTGRA